MPKKIILISLLCAVLILMAGCAQTTEVPDQVSAPADDEKKEEAPPPPTDTPVPPTAEPEVEDDAEAKGPLLFQIAAQTVDTSQGSGFHKCACHLFCGKQVAIRIEGSQHCEQRLRRDPVLPGDAGTLNDQKVRRCDAEFFGEETPQTGQSLFECRRFARPFQTCYKE